MALITWSNLLSTGISEQDNQHKRLIALINQLNEAVLDGKGSDILGEVLSQLIDYTAYHFDYEENLMSMHEFENTAEHKREHVHFAETVTDFKRKFDSGEAVVSVEIINFLRDWLTRHIMKTDKVMGHALVRMGIK